MDPTLAVVLAAVASVITGFMTYRASTRATRSNALLQWAEQLRQSESEARAVAEENRKRAEQIRERAEANVDRLHAKLAELENRLGEATTAVGELADKLAVAQAELWRAEPDIPTLRRIVGRPSSR